MTRDYDAGRAFLERVIANNDGSPLLQQSAFDAMLRFDIEHEGPWTGPVWWHKVGETND